MIKTIIRTIALPVTIAFLVFGCGEKNAEGQNAEVAMEVLQNTVEINADSVTVNVKTEFVFAVEDDGEHVGGLSPAPVEIVKEGATAGDEMTVSEDTNDPGHYNGSYTFADTGVYSIHFEFQYNGEEMDEEFSVTVK